MIDAEAYLSEFTAELKRRFGNRLCYIGLQGSYLRGEADENSDIDIMAVIDGLSVGDLDEYRKAAEEVGNFDKSCGFICGTDELRHWNPLEICHLIHTTKDYYGELCGLVPEYTLEDERNYIKLGINNFYHELCHMYIHGNAERNISRLATMCKAVFFIMQNLYYLKNGVFVMTKQELLEKTCGMDRKVLEMAVSLKNDATYDFDEVFEALFDWCGETLRNI